MLNEKGKYFRVVIGKSYLLGLLAKIKCSICSNQCENWFPWHRSWTNFHIHFSKYLKITAACHVIFRIGFRGPSTPPLRSLTTITLYLYYHSFTIIISIYSKWMVNHPNCMCFLPWLVTFYGSVFNSLNTTS